MGSPRIGIIIGTTREGRFGDKPAQWIHAIATQRSDLEFEIVDLRDYPLPLYDEQIPPLYSPSKNSVAQRWNAKIAELDGYIFITSEYNHGMSGVLKNALDHSYPEFNRKPAAFVGYGGVGSARAVEQLRLVCIELQLAPTRTGVHITLEPFLAAMKGEKKLADFDFLNQGAEQMLEELVWWTRTLKAGRDKPG
jgi:NAD(P)H-dependent FMN reductase